MTQQYSLTLRHLNQKRLWLGLLSFLLGTGTLIFLLSLNLKMTPDSLLGLSFTVWDWANISWIGLILAALAYGVTGLNGGLFIKKLPNMVEIYPNIKSEESKIGDVAVEDIVKWTTELASEMSVEIRTILIHEAHEPNAATSFSIGKGNLIFLNRNLIEICTPEGIKSVIAHELGHVDGSDVIWQVLSVLPQRLAGLWLFILCMQCAAMIPFAETFWAFVMRSLAAVGCLFLGGILLGIVKRFSQMYSQTKEYIADIAAAQAVSPEGVINALLRVYARSHTLGQFKAGVIKTSGSDIFNEAVRFFPIGDLSREDIQSAIPKALVRAQLSMIERWFQIEIPQAKKLAWLKEIEALEPKIKPSEAAGDFAWRVFDLNQDGYLQKREIAVLIHRLMVDETALNSGGGDHPPMRDRILKVAQAFDIQAREA